MKKCIVITTMLLVAAGLTEKMYAIDKTDNVIPTKADNNLIGKASVNSIAKTNNVLPTRINNAPISRANALTDKAYAVQSISFPVLNRQQLRSLLNSSDKRVRRAAQNIQTVSRNGIMGLQANLDLIASQDKVTQSRGITLARLVVNPSYDIAQAAAYIANLPIEMQKEYLKKLQTLISYNHHNSIQKPEIKALRQELLGMLMDMQHDLDISKKKPMHVSGTSRNQHHN